VIGRCDGLQNLPQPVRVPPYALDLAAQLHWPGY
jgi:hypothetical protein